MSKVDGVTCQRVNITSGSWSICSNVFLFVGGNAIFTQASVLVRIGSVYGVKIYPMRLG